MKTFLLFLSVFLTPMILAKSENVKFLEAFKRNGDQENHFVKLMLSQTASTIVFEKIDLKSFNEIAIYKCLFMQSGLEKQNFIFFLTPSKNPIPVVTTESSHGIKTLLNAIDNFAIPSDDPIGFVKDVMTLYRPWYTLYNFIDYNDHMPQENRHVWIFEFKPTERLTAGFKITNDILILTKKFQVWRKAERWHFELGDIWPSQSGPSRRQP